MPKKSKIEYTAFQEAQILWECDFPSRPGLLESLLQERIERKKEADAIEARVKEINTVLMAFFDNNRIPGVKFDVSGEGDYYTIAKKSGAQVTLNKEALVLEGVKAEVIERCTNRTPWTTVECREDKKHG